jgi:hypothetical protein
MPQAQRRVRTEPTAPPLALSPRIEIPVGIPEEATLRGRNSVRTLWDIQTLTGQEMSNAFLPLQHRRIIMGSDEAVS